MFWQNFSLKFQAIVEEKTALKTLGDDFFRAL